jgi:hypothetical protein
VTRLNGSFCLEVSQTRLSAFGQLFKNTVAVECVKDGRFGDFEGKQAQANLRALPSNCDPLAPQDFCAGNGNRGEERSGAAVETRLLESSAKRRGASRVENGGWLYASWVTIAGKCSKGRMTLLSRGWRTLTEGRRLGVWVLVW